jgi:hypothetical protein
MKNKLFIWLFLAFITHCFIAVAQNDSVSKAILIITDASIEKEKAVKQAMGIIDRAIKVPQHEKSAHAWYVRGYVYKEYYKMFEAGNKQSPARSNALSYLKNALNLDKNKEYDTEIRQSLKYIGSTYYNDAATAITPASYNQAIANYENFKQIMLLADPTYDLKAVELNFKTVLADLYAKIFKSNIIQNGSYFNQAETTYKDVLKLDTNNWSANFNLAMLYYNYGVDIIYNMDVGEDIVVVSNIQDNARAQFRKALPYALKAYSLKPKEKRVLTALQGIYFSLYEQEKSNEFKKKIELLDK